MKKRIGELEQQVAAQASLLEIQRATLSQAQAGPCSPRPNGMADEGHRDRQKELYPMQEVLDTS